MLATECQTRTTRTGAPVKLGMSTTRYMLEFASAVRARVKDRVRLRKDVPLFKAKDERLGLGRWREAGPHLTSLATSPHLFELGDCSPKG